MNTRVLCSVFCASVLLAGGPIPAGALASETPTVILCSRGASETEAFAAREIRRYVYLRTGALLPIRVSADGQNAIAAARKDRPVIDPLRQEPDAKALLGGLGEQDYLLLTHHETGGRQVLYLTGGSDAAVLYAAYRFAEHLGIRFYLHGDVAPDTQVPFRLPELNEKASPSFPLRGIQPFHDFPEGPDWWSTNDYLAIIGQLPKLRMNFIGLHTYPEDRPNAEPTVWIGLPQDFHPDGAVKFSYPASYYNTALAVSWGFKVTKTSEYRCGAAALFSCDEYGSEIMRDLTPKPETLDQCNEVFDRTAAMLREAFGLATALGVKTCVGTETPLVVPKRVKERVDETQAKVKDLYAGMFSRIMKAYPIDYYWLWTPEGWTWEGVTPEDTQKTVDDILTAQSAMEQIGAPFRLATSGWVLGPQFDRAYLDKVLPKDIAVSCISRRVGHDPVEPAFAQVTGREKWAIPWLEDDPAMTSPQLWVGRMRRDAGDALAYGCTGLLGIHWRTRVIAPNVAALAQAAWDQSSWGKSAPASDAAEPSPDDFYADWALREFGPEAGPGAAAIFTAIDGRLPRPSDWVNGPGGYRPDTRSWEEVKGEYAFADQLAALRPLIETPGNLARFDYWLEELQFLRGTAHMRCAWGEYDEAMKKVDAESDPAARMKLARETALPRRVALVEIAHQTYQHLLATVNTSGDMGTVCNLEQHTFPVMLDEPGTHLSETLGEPLPAEALLSNSYQGAPRLIVPTVRTFVSPGEALTVNVILLDNAPAREIVIAYRAIGGERYRRRPIEHVARNTYQARIPANRIPKSGLEYYVEAVTDAHETIRWPATAGTINQTVIRGPRR